MDCTDIDGNRYNNNEMENEFEDFADDNVSLDDIVISEEFINEGLYDIDIKQRDIDDYGTKEDENIDDQTVIGFIIQIPQESIQNYLNIKDQNIDNLIIVIPGTELISECKDDEVCPNEAVISEGYTKQELCSMNDELESIQNYLGITDENIDDLPVVAQEMVPITDCMDNKVCIYETITSEGYNKEQPGDTENNSESIHNNINMKVCEECGEEYDLYCLGCPMLARIFDRNNPDGKDNTLGWTLPKGIIDICQTPSGVAIVALRTIPKGVVFGPFQGLVSTKDDTVSKWTLRNNKLVCIKDPRWLNWMQYIRKADHDSQQNFEPFQYKGGLYYRSECQIKAGDEILVGCNTYSKESENQDMEDTYWEPSVCESLGDSYACTFCCVGYKSISHLKAHNSTCIEKKDKKDFCGDIIQCDICNIYLDKKEYSDYHRNRCYKSNKEYVFKSRNKKNRAPPLQYDSRYGDNNFSCRLCAYKTKRRWRLRRHVATHYGDKPFACTFCPYKGNSSSKLERHIATHNDGKPYACTLCPYKTPHSAILKRHMGIHNDNRFIACNICPYKTKKASSLKRHIAIHNGEKRFTCPVCYYKAKRASNMKRHMTSHNDDKPYACTICSYKTKTNFSLKRHVCAHKGNKPFACTLCPYRAKIAANLKQHIAIHNDDRPFACTICSYKAKTRLTLKRHITTHNDDKPFACTLCPYKANKASTLKRHINTHNGDKPFVCTLCTFKAMKPSILKRHLRSHNV